VNAE
jgi:hypothetical protein